MGDSAQKSGSKAVQAAKPQRAAKRGATAAAYGPSSQIGAIGTLHEWAGNGAVSRLLGGGTPLSADMRLLFERRFGADFSSVRIHDGDSANASAGLLDANAFTVGNDIVFSSNQFAPHSRGGQRLIAHELAHVVQQRRGGAAPPLASSAAHEGAADAAASAFATGTGPVAVAGATAVGVARDEKKQFKDWYWTAFFANRYWLASSKIEGWPIDADLGELWAKVPVTDEKSGGHSPEFKKFADAVRDYQRDQMGMKGNAASGIVDPRTAAHLARAKAERDAKAAKDAKDKADKDAREAEAAKQREDALKSVKTSLGSSASGTMKLGKSPTEALADRALSFAMNPSGEMTSLVKNTVADFGVGQIKSMLVDLLLKSIGLPPAGMKIANAVGRGMGEQLAHELITEGKGAQLLKHLKDFNAGDSGEFLKGYYIGLVEGLVSPVTDLFGIVVFGETMKNRAKELAISAFNNRGRVQKEFDELMEEAGNVTLKLGEFWKKIREKPAEAIVAMLNAPAVLEHLAEQKAYEFGKIGGSMIVASLEEPWKPKKEKGKTPDPIVAPAAYVEHMAKAAEDYVLDTPWSKIGSKVGYAIGFVVIQAVLIAFTSGIGNAIEEVGVALGKVGNALNKVSKGIGSVVTKVADFVKVLGEGITVIENGIMKVLEKLIEKVPFASSLLKPVGKLFEKLRNFLRKLFGVAEKEGVALVEGATKTALSAADEAPLLAPKATPPPPVNPNVTSPTKPKVTGSTGVSKPADASKTVTPFSRDARPAASEASKKLEQDLARQKPDAGKVSPLKPKGKPDPLPPAQSQRVPAQLAQEDAGKVAVGQSHGSGKGGTLQQGPGGKAANTQAARQGEPTVNAGGKSKPSGSTSSSTKGPSTSSKSSSAKGPSAPSKSAGTKTPPSTKKSAGSSGGSKQAGSSAGKTGTASSGTGTRRPKLPPPLKGLSNPKAPRPARIDFVKRNRDLLGPRQRADFDALKGKPKNNAQLRAWEERIDEGLRAQQSARVARSVGAKPGNVSTARRPKSGPRSGGYEWEETHAGLRGEPQNDFTHSVATDTDKAQFDSLGKPGGKVDPLENKAYDKPPTDFEPPRRPSFDSYDQILRNNRDAAKAAERFLAKEEDRLWKAHELADQMERQARIARDLKWPPVKWPMHSKAVDDYFTREVLPLVSRELRDHIRLVPEYFFD